MVQYSDCCRILKRIIGGSGGGASGGGGVVVVLVVVGYWLCWCHGGGCK